MKLSELIEQLQIQYSERGDVPIYLVVNGEVEPAVGLDYDDYGDGEGTVVEIVAADDEPRLKPPWLQSGLSG